MSFHDFGSVHVSMKAWDFVNMNDIEQEGEERLLEMLARVPFLKTAPLKKAADDGIDFLVKVAVGDGKPWTLACVVKANPRPSIARMAAITLTSLLHKWTERSYGVLITPLVSEQTRKICLDCGIGCVDLAGNCFLSFNNVHIDRLGRTRQPPPKQLYPALFGTKSERLLRFLLRFPRQSWKVHDLANHTDVSVGLVSKVRGALLENGWAAAGEDGLRLTSPDELIDAWRVAYKRPKNLQGFYTGLRGPELQEALRIALKDADHGAHAVLAGESAAQWLAPYVTGGPLELYADDIGLNALSHHLGLRQVSRGANVLITHPKDEGVLQDRISPVPGLWCTSPIQTYLDLATAGDRHAEAAEHLRREILNPLLQREK
jgi:hypothetical protein